jgi:hypothetical protein
MSFKNKIPGCFGSADKRFAGHSCEVDRAKDMLIEALQETQSWGEVEGAIREYLSGQGCSQEHIDEQIERVKETRRYFNYD